MSKNIVVLLLAVLACRVNSYGEADQNGHPTWEERANHLFVNAVRLDPTNYKAKLWNNFKDISTGAALSASSILQTSSYPAVNAVYLTNGLLRSSYNHSLDMATYPGGCFQHNTCGSTQDVFTRIKMFCPCDPGTLGENIAAGYGSPLDVNNQWLCDETNSVCAVDKSGNDGHRSNIMSSSYTAIGIGYAYSSSSTYKYYWTQDFSNCLKLGDGTYTSPVYGGTHYPLTVSGTAYTYFSAVWSNSTAPSSANVIIGGTSSSLSLYLGSASAGIYSVAFTSTIAVGTQYYFQFGTQRFPDTGFLVVVGTGYASAWVAGSAATTAAPTTVATTAAPTTVATTAAPTTAATTAAPTTVAPTTAAATTTRPASTSAPTTASPTTTRPASTAAPTTKPATTAAPTTSSTTPAPTTRATTPAPTTQATTAAPTTRATTPAPTTQATTAAPTTRAPTTAVPTTSSVTPPPSSGWIFSSGLLNSWSTYQNSGQAAIVTTSFLGQSALQITLAGGSASTNFFWFAHTADVSSTLYTNLIFNIASTSSTSVAFYFNGEYTQSVSASASAYVTSTTRLSNMLQSGHTTIGSSGHQLVFQNPSSSAITIYLYNIQLA